MYWKWRCPEICAIINMNWRLVITVCYVEWGLCEDWRVVCMSIGCWSIWKTPGNDYNQMSWGMMGLPMRITGADCSSSWLKVCTAWRDELPWDEPAIMQKADRDSGVIPKLNWISRSWPGNNRAGYIRKDMTKRLQRNWQTFEVGWSKN